MATISRRGRHRLVAACAALLIAAPITGARAGEPYHSPWDGPWNPSVSAEQTERFVELWSARIRDRRFLEGYLARPEVPAEIRDEGFHELDLHTQMYLTTRLFDRLTGLVASLATEVSAGDRKALDEQRALLYLFVFDKQWVRRLRTDAAEPPPPVPAEPTQPDALERTVTKLKQLRAAEIDRLGSREPRSITRIPVSKALALSSGSGSTMREVVRLTSVDAPTVPRPGFPTRAGAVQGGFLTYSVCSSVGGCSPPIPLGTPFPVDNTGDGQPDSIATLGLATPEVPKLEVLPKTRIGFSFELRQIATAPRLLRDHVAVIVDVPQIRRRIAVGFNGFETSLAGRSVISFGVDPTAIAGSVANQVTSLEAVVTHDGGTFPNLLSYSLQTIAATDVLGQPVEPPPAPEPVYGQIRFTPVPSSLAVTLSVNRIPTQESYRALLVSSVPTKLDVDAHAQIGADRWDLLTTIDRLPQSIEIIYEPLAQRFTYDASAVIERITLAAALVTPGPVTQVFGDVSNLPDRLTVTFSPNGFLYEASAVVPVVSASLVYSPTPGQPAAIVVGGSVIGIPSRIQMTFDMEARRLTWNATSPVTEASAYAHLAGGGRIWDAGLTLTGIPASWEATFGDRYVWRGISGPLGSVRAWVSNLGVVGVCSVDENCVYAAYDQRNGNVVGSFNMNAVSLVEVDPTDDGFVADLRMGGGGPFFVVAELYGTPSAFGFVEISQLPTQVRLAHAGDTFVYDANANFDIFALVSAGHPAAIPATPAPPNIHGVSVRDGAGCAGGDCGTAVKALVYLSGVPTHVAFNPRAGSLLEVQNFRPILPLALDVHLDNLVASTRLSASLTVPSPVDFTISSVTTSTDAAGTRRVDMGFTANPGMGPFVASLEKGTDAAFVAVSNIPSSVGISVIEANGSTTVSTRLAQQINQIEAHFRRVSDATFGAGVSLYQVPTVIDLTFGRVSGVNGSTEATLPGLTYTASSNTLDLVAYAEASLFGGDVRAWARAEIGDLGSSTTATLQGTTLQMTSNYTRLLELRTWGQIRYLTSWDVCLPGNCPTFRLRTYGHAGVVPVTIDNLRVRLEGLTSLTVQAGLTSSVQGAFSSFFFGWDRINITTDVEAYLQACASTYCFDIVPGFHHHRNFNLNVLFQVAGNHHERWQHGDTPLPCFAPDLTPGFTHVHVGLQPHPHTAAWNGVTLGAPGAEGAWLVIPNPLYGSGLVPDWVAWNAGWLAMGYTSPLGGGATVAFPCTGDWTHDSQWG